MKKRIIATLMVAVLAAAMLTGCGKEKKKSIEDITTEELEQALANLDDGYEDSSDTEATEDIFSLKKTYKESKDWKKLGADSRAVQVGDTVVYPGMTVAQLDEKLKKSNIKWKYDYNADRLVEGGQDAEISIFASAKDTVESFDVYALNLKKETGKLADAVIVGVNVSDDAKPYSRFIDGRSYDDILKLKYDDVKNMKSSDFQNLVNDYKENTTKVGDKDCIVVSYQLSDGAIKEAKWTDYDVMCGYTFDFTVDSNSGKVISYDNSKGMAYTWDLSKTGEYITDVNQISDDMLKKLDEVIRKVIDEDKSGQTYTIGSMYEMFMKPRAFSDNEYTLYVVYNATSDSGQYTMAQVDMPQKTNMGYINASMVYTYDFYDSVDAMLEDQWISTDNISSQKTF